MNSLIKVGQDVEQAREWAKNVAHTIKKQRKEIYYKDIQYGTVGTLEDWTQTANDCGWDLKHLLDNEILIETDREEI